MYLGQAGKGHAISNGTLYVTVRNKGLYIFNVANPSNAEFVSEMPVKGNAHSVCIENETLFVGSITGPVSIYDIKAPFSPKRINTVNGHGEAAGICVRKGILVIADQKEGVLVYDVSNPKLPVFMARQEAHVHRAWYDGEYVYVSGDDGLKIFRISDH